MKNDIQVTLYGLRYTFNSHSIIVFSDPDAPTRSNATFREILHWRVVNIPGTDVSNGDTLTEYIGSGPPQGTGLHRYIFLVYKQPGKIDFKVPRVSNRSREGRRNFKARQFAAEYNLGSAIAGNFYQAEYDDYVPKLHEQLKG